MTRPTLLAALSLAEAVAGLRADRLAVGSVTSRGCPSSAETRGKARSVLPEQLSCG